MRMQPLKNGLIEVFIKELDIRFFVTSQEEAIKIAFKLGGAKC
ncbi:hypothetical protein [Psychrilyobacter sp.]